MRKSLIALTTIALLSCGGTFAYISHNTKNAQPIENSKQPPEQLNASPFPEKKAAPETPKQKAPVTEKKTDIINKPITENSKKLLDQIEKNKRQMEMVKQLIQNLEQQNKQLEKPAQKESNPLSPTERAAIKSPIFTPGGAPRSPYLDERYNYYRNLLLNKQRQERENATKQNQDKDKKQVNDKERDNVDDDTTDSMSNFNNNTNPIVPPYINYNTSFVATFTPQNTPYAYKIQAATGMNPFEGVSSNPITIKFSGNGTTYEKVRFCNTKYENSSCGDKQTLSDNSIKIADSNSVITDSETKGGYISKSLTVNGKTAYYHVGTVYAQLFTSSSETTPTNIQFSFPVSNCSQNGDNLSCSITSSTTSSISKIS